MPLCYSGRSIVTRGFGRSIGCIGRFVARIVADAEWNAALVSGQTRVAIMFLRPTCTKGWNRRVRLVVG